MPQRKSTLILSSQAASRALWHAMSNQIKPCRIMRHLILCKRKTLSLVASTKRQAATICRSTPKKRVHMKIWALIYLCFIIYCFITTTKGHKSIERGCSKKFAIIIFSLRYGSCTTVYDLLWRDEHYTMR